MKKLLGVLLLLLTLPAVGQTRKEVKFKEAIRPTRSYTGGPYRVDVLTVDVVDGGVVAYARAWKNGKQLGLGAKGETDIERFIFYNIDPEMEDKNVITGATIDEDGNPVVLYGKKEDPDEVMRLAIIETVRLTGRDDTVIKPGSVGRTTSTFYPDASPESTSVDGYTRRDPDGTWSELHDGAGTNAIDNGSVGPTPEIISAASSGQWSQMARSFFLFDTSSIPSTDAISSSTLSIYGTNKTDNFNQDVVVDKPSTASNTALANSDHRYDGWAGVEQSTARIDVTSWATAAYNDFTLNATGIGNIDKDGVTKFGLRLSSDFDNSEPTWAASTTARVNANFADQAGTVNDPKLVVVHESASSTFVPRIMIISNEPQSPHYSPWRWYEKAVVLAQTRKLRPPISYTL